EDRPAYEQLETWEKAYLDTYLKLGIDNSPQVLYPFVTDETSQEGEVTMKNPTHRTALVTGASSGLGLEASAQFAEQGFERVVITARTEEKAKATLSELETRTGKKVFETLILDNDRLATPEAAAAELANRGGQIDVLVLNAGIAPPKDLVRSEDGLEATVASTLVGHHLLTMGLLEKDLLSANARIVISGSEAARGDVPTFKPLNVDEFAAEHFDGDLEAVIDAQMFMKAPVTYKASNTYATAKVFVAWWAAELSRMLPDGMTVNAVSPGSTPETNAVRNAPFYMRRLMVPLFKLIPGMSHTVADGAGRYIEAASYDDEITGKFFASKPGKMIGPLEEIEMDHIQSRAGQGALWNKTVEVAGGVGFPTMESKPTEQELAS
ncbi:MAG: SDR family NAD(P)-dependent oxidoreductase, partial [Acidimicrobiia bacterium]